MSFSTDSAFSFLFHVPSCPRLCPPWPPRLCFCPSCLASLALPASASPPMPSPPPAEQDSERQPQHRAVGAGVRGAVCSWEWKVQQAQVSRGVAPARHATWVSGPPPAEPQARLPHGRVIGGLLTPGVACGEVAWASHCPLGFRATALKSGLVCGAPEGRVASRTDPRAGGVPVASRPHSSTPENSSNCSRTSFFLIYSIICKA